MILRSGLSESPKESGGILDVQNGMRIMYHDYVQQKSSVLQNI